MSKVVVRAEGVGKRYTRGRRAPYETLRDMLSLKKGGQREDANTFWALRDLDLEVREGETLGIIGHNGAGKSTLLKVLSRIVHPTEGRLHLDGRVGSLLEVGTGFHPDLTGRENIYLNGAVLGMSRGEVSRKFDEIVDFAEVEMFLDTPVKRYSSGMYTRLAFAVAAHLEPEILIVDEVLAVGDAAFQRRCLGKMSDAARSGRTVLFVSHNMSAIEGLCSRAVLMFGGRAIFSGTPGETVRRYLDGLGGAGGADRSLAEKIAALRPDPRFALAAVRLVQDGRPANVVFNDRPLEVEIDFTVERPDPDLRIYIELADLYGGVIAKSWHDERAEAATGFGTGAHRLKFRLPAAFLGPAPYRLAVGAEIYRRGQLEGQRIDSQLAVEEATGRNTARPASGFSAKVVIAGTWTHQAIP